MTDLGDGTGGSELPREAVVDLDLDGVIETLRMLEGETVMLEVGTGAGWGKTWQGHVATAGKLSVPEWADGTVGAEVAGTRLFLDKLKTAWLYTWDGNDFFTVGLEFSDGVEVILQEETRAERHLMSVDEQRARRRQDQEERARFDASLHELLESQFGGRSEGELSEEEHGLLWRLANLVTYGHRWEASLLSSEFEGRGLAELTSAEQEDFWRRMQEEQGGSTLEDARRAGVWWTPGATP